MYRTRMGNNVNHKAMINCRCKQYGKRYMFIKITNTALFLTGSLNIRNKIFQYNRNFFLLLKTWRYERVAYLIAQKLYNPRIIIEFYIILNDIMIARNGATSYNNDEGLQVSPFQNGGL